MLFLHQKRYKSQRNPPSFSCLNRDGSIFAENSCMKTTAAKTSRSALDYFPAEIDLPHLTSAAAACKGCDIYKNATQTVFGEGKAAAKVILVGEQPGDEEDIAGLPFVGPSGKLLDRALEEAGIDRADTYVTNAVKHFKWKPQGKRRLHERPKAGEIAACRPWLSAEIEVIRPRILVLLGATAAQSLLSKDFRVTKERGLWLDFPLLAEKVIATVHPSSILRAPASERAAAYEQFLRDLSVVAKALKSL